jgi:hypothetical protein
VSKPKCDAYGQPCASHDTTVRDIGGRAYNFCDECYARHLADVEADRREMQEIRKRETKVGMEIPATDWMDEDFIMEQWKVLLKGFDAIPKVWREGTNYVMEAYFVTEAPDGAEFAARLTNLTGIVCKISVLPTVH